MSIESISPNAAQQVSQTTPERTAPVRPSNNLQTEAGNKEGVREQVVKSAEESKARQEALSKAVSNLNQFFQAVRRELQFAVDDQTGRTIITVSDSDTNQVIRQIPGDEVLALARNIADRGEASLIQEEA